MTRKRSKYTFYAIWDTGNECLDSTITYDSLEDAQEICDDRNRQLQAVEILADGYMEYVGELPTVYEVRKVTVEQVVE